MAGSLGRGLPVLLQSLLYVVSGVLLVWPSIIKASRGFAWSAFVAVGIFLLLVAVARESRGRAVRVGTFVAVTTLCYWASHFVWASASSGPVYYIDHRALEPTFYNIAIFWMMTFGIALPYEIYGVITSVRETSSRLLAVVGLLLLFQMTTAGYIGFKIVTDILLAY